MPDPEEGTLQGAADAHAAGTKPEGEDVTPGTPPPADDIPSHEDMEKAAAMAIPDSEGKPKAVEVPPVVDDPVTPEPSSGLSHSESSALGRKVAAEKERNDKLQTTVDNLTGQVEALTRLQGGEAPADALPPLPEVIATTEDVMAVLDHRDAQKDAERRTQQDVEAGYEKSYLSRFEGIKADPQYEEIRALMVSQDDLRFNAIHHNDPAADFQINYQAVKLHLLTKGATPPVPATPALKGDDAAGTGVGAPTKSGEKDKPVTKVTDPEALAYAKYLKETEKEEDIDGFVEEAMSGEQASTLVIKGRQS